MREYPFGPDLEVTTDSHYSQVLTRIATLNYRMMFNDGGQLTATGNSTFESLERPFGIGPTLIVAPGEYRYEDAGLSYTSNRSAMLSGSAGVNAGTFWDGHQKTIEGSLRLRVNAHVAASATLTRNDVDLPQGSFAANLVGMRLDWSFSPRMFLNAFVQYNGETDTWLSNIRYNFIHRPLSDIYIVWNATRMPTEDHGALMLKYTHLLAF